MVESCPSKVWANQPCLKELDLGMILVVAEFWELCTATLDSTKVPFGDIIWKQKLR